MTKTRAKGGLSSRRCFPNDRQSRRQNGGRPVRQRFDQDGVARFAVAFGFLDGQEPQPEEDLAPDFFALGQISARLHAHAKSWTKPSGFTRKYWTADTMVGPQGYWGSWRDAPGLTEDGADLLQRLEAALRDRLDRYGTNADRFGLIHGDLRFANLLRHEDRLAVIDFDDCGFGWFMFDFAAAVSFFEDHTQIPALWDVAPLSAADEAMLDTFILLRRLQLTAWIGSHAEVPFAAELGAGYTKGTLDLAETYLTGSTGITSKA